MTRPLALATLALSALLLTVGLPALLASDGADAERSEPQQLVLDEAARAAADGSNVEFIQLGSGCRFFDTRNAGGAFGVSSFRDLSIRDAAIPGQGGKAGGCGIPPHATAVDLSLSTTGNSPTNAGFVRVGEGGTAPVATVLQFLKNQGTSVTTTGPVNGNGLMRIQVFGASTHLVGDLLGYWQQAAHITVSHDPVGGHNIESFSGASEIELGSTGQYSVTFDREIVGCTVTTGNTITGTAAKKVVEAQISGSVAVVVDVYKSTDGTAIDGGFSLAVQC